MFARLFGIIDVALLKFLSSLPCQLFEICTCTVAGPCCVDSVGQASFLIFLAFLMACSASFHCETVAGVSQINVFCAHWSPADTLGAPKCCFVGTSVDNFLVCVGQVVIHDHQYDLLRFNELRWVLLNYRLLEWPISLISGSGPTKYLFPLTFAPFGKRLLLFVVASIPSPLEREIKGKRTTRPACYDVKKGESPMETFQRRNAICFSTAYLQFE